MVAGDRRPAMHGLLRLLLWPESPEIDGPLAAEDQPCVAYPKHLLGPDSPGPRSSLATEDHRCVAYPKFFSPARIGTGSLFSAGVIGHVQASL